MGLSTTLLVVAVVTAVAPMVSTFFRPPATLRDIEKSFVVGIGAAALGTVVAVILHDVDFFGFVHLAYLFGVVTIPVLLIGWWFLAFVRRGRTLLIRIGGLVGVIVALLGVWGTHIEPNWLQTDNVAVTAPVSAPLRIGVIADLQTPNVGKHEWNAIDTIIEASPDLVLIPGDLFQGSSFAIDAARPDFVSLLGRLTAEAEVVAIVSGDSDRPGELQSLALAAGAIFIDNDIVDLTIAGQPVRLAGVPVETDRQKIDTIAALGTPSEAFTILLSHRPDVVFELPLGTDVDLIVSGHTHGGQISLPFIGPPVTLSDVPRDIAAGGLGLVDNFPVYVSAGVGLERGQSPQVRFGVRPEVGIIDVVPAG